MAADGAWMTLAIRWEKFRAWLYAERLTHGELFCLVRPWSSVP